jgi:uncharacterized membrane protein YfcA
MTRNDPDDRAVRAWQSQPEAEAEMNASDIRVKSELFTARATAQMRLGAIALAVVVIGNILEMALESDEMERIGSGLTILAVAFVAFDYFRRKRRDSAASPSGALDSRSFYRAALLRQRAQLGQFWWRWVLPFVPGISLSVFGRSIVAPRSPGQYLVMGLLLAVLLGGIALVNRREARKIQDEIDELDS